MTSVRDSDLTKEELEYAFMGYLENKIPNYQISALLMAIVLNGMDMDSRFLVEFFDNLFRVRE